MECRFAEAAIFFCDILMNEGSAKSSASVGDVMQAMIYSGMNGIGLALVVPCVQSLIADYTLAEQARRCLWRPVLHRRHRCAADAPCLCPSGRTLCTELEVYN